MQSLLLRETHGPTTAHSDRDIDLTPVVTESTSNSIEHLAMLLNGPSLTFMPNRTHIGMGIKLL